MSLLTNVVLLLCCVAQYHAEDYQVGSMANTTLAYQEAVKLGAIPFGTRTKNVFYSSDKIIKSIAALDLDKTKGKATITAGGVGSLHVNLRLKSENGKRLNYLVQVFA